MSAPAGAPQLAVPLWVHGGQVGYEPWLHLGVCEGINVTWHEEGPRGETDFATKTISLRTGLSVRERRATLAHELVHIERGPVCSGVGTYAIDLVEESIVEASAALRLIPSFVLEDLPLLVDRYGLEAAEGFLGIDRAMIGAAVDSVTLARRAVR